MASITVRLPDGSPLELEEGATGADAAAAIGPRLAKDALAVRVNGEVRDLARPLDDGERVEIVTPGRPDALEVLRHDAAHVLATAVLDLWLPSPWSARWRWHSPVAAAVRRRARAARAVSPPW